MKMNRPPDSSRVVSAVARVADVDRLERRARRARPATSVAEQRLDVRPGRELVDEVARHALLERVAAAEDRHAARVGGEEQRRLPRRVAGADDVDVEPVRVRRLAARRAVGDALAGRAGRSRRSRGAARSTPQARMIVRARRTSPPSRCTCAGRGVDPRDRAGDEDLGAEPPRLLQRAARQLVARHARGEAEVVLDPRGRAGLAAGRLALDHDRAQALRRAVHGGGQARRAGADDHRVVLRRARARSRGRAARPPGAAAAGPRSCRRRPGSPAGPRRRAAGRPSRSAASGRLGREPLERDLVAVEEAPQLGAGRVPAVPDDDRARRRRLGGDALQPARSAHPVGREPADLLGDVGRHGRDRVVVVRLDPHDARRLRRAEADREHRPEHDRHLAEDVARVALADARARSRRRA